MSKNTFIEFGRTTYRRFSISLSSGDEDYPGTRLLFAAWGWNLIFNLGGLLLPARKWHDMSKHVGKPSYKWLKQNKDGTYGYYEINAREYSFTWADGYWHVHYGATDNDSRFDHSWTKEIPWLAWQFRAFRILDLLGKEIYEELESARLGAKFIERYDRKQLLINANAAYFEFIDFDDEHILAQAHFEEREWTRGTGWFAWLRYLYPKMVRTSLSLEFSSEVGAKKGSWKGGTLGHGIDSSRDESALAAFGRYCLKQNLKYCGTIDKSAWDLVQKQKEEIRAANAAQQANDGPAKAAGAGDTQ